MAEKETKSTKTKATKKENVKTAKINNHDEKTVTHEDIKNTVIRETITYDNTPIFNKILICLYVIIALLALNIIMTAIRGNVNSNASNNTNTTDNTEQTDTTTYDVSKFKTITADEFVQAFNKDELSLIYIGRPTCGYCIKFVPVLTEVQEKYKFQTLYLDIDTITSDESQQIIALDNEFFTGENTAFGFTPSTLIVRNGEIVDSQIGASDASTLEALVSKYFDKK